MVCYRARVDRAAQTLLTLTLDDFLAFRAAAHQHAFTDDTMMLFARFDRVDGRQLCSVLASEAEARAIVDGLMFEVPAVMAGMPPFIAPSEHTGLVGAVDACIYCYGLREVVVGEVTLAPDHVSPITGRRQLRPLGTVVSFYSPVEHWASDRLAMLLDGREAGTARDAVIAAVQAAADEAGLT